MNSTCNLILHLTRFGSRAVRSLHINLLWTQLWLSTSSQPWEISVELNYNNSTCSWNIVHHKDSQLWWPLTMELIEHKGPFLGISLAISTGAEHVGV
ncbi:hypothetical protein V1527DRAFT_463801 [Lipomyces starkeyi]